VGLRVLLVEDSPTMRSFVATALEDAGDVELIEAASGFAALQALPGARFDLVISDVNMPDINGLELIRFIRSNPAHAKVPLVMISTDGRERDRERCMSLGANGYLVKPFRPEVLIEEIRRHVTLP
jgi:two-component system chemotaxis response regulator CheY